ncbi:MAG TPA: glycosyltransferase [Pyrinomonadaceae bacterium]
MSGSTMHVIINLNGGGAERLLTNLLTQQSSTNGDTCVVCLQGEGVFRSSLESSGVEVIDLGMRRRRDTLSALFKLAELIRERRPAVVQGWMYNANIFASLALFLAGRQGTQLLWGIFCSDTCSNGDVRKNFFPVLGRFFSRYVDGVIYNAAQARDFHRAFGFREPRSLVIPNCVDTKTFHRDPGLRQSARLELGIPEDSVIVMIVARVDPMKNWEGMLDAVRDLPGIVTVGLGKGTDELPPQPGFMGLGWRDDVQRLLSAADIFLLASVSGEGTSMAMVEAMSCSLPCVVTDVGGNGSFIRGAGIVVPPRRIDSIREAILRLAKDRRLREQTGHAARARIATGYSADDVATIFRSFLETAGGAA